MNPGVCPSCGAPSEGSNRFCRACKSYTSVLDDPGSTQIMVIAGWLPAFISAVVGGIAVMLLTGDAWRMPIVLAAGSVLGWLATMVVFFSTLAIHARHPLRPWVADVVFVLALYCVGPGVAIGVAILAAIVWV